MLLLLWWGPDRVEIHSTPSNNLIGDWLSPGVVSNCFSRFWPKWYPFTAVRVTSTLTLCRRFTVSRIQLTSDLALVFRSEKHNFNKTNIRFILLICPYMERFHYLICWPSEQRTCISDETVYSQTLKLATLYNPRASTTHRKQELGNIFSANSHILFWIINQQHATIAS